MVALIMDSLKMIKNQEKVQNAKKDYNIYYKKTKVYYGYQMEINMMDNDKIIKLMEKVIEIKVYSF